MHAIIKFKNGLVKLLMHEPDMKIPIYNSIYSNIFKNKNPKPIDLNIMNNLNLKKVDLKNLD